MPKTVQEVLKESGMTDEAIKALDAKVMQGFTSVLSTATSAEQAAAAAREEAERASRGQREMYDTQIAPALDAWANEKAQYAAEISFYRTQAEQAKAGGFVPKDAPGYVPPAADANAGRGADGRYVSGANPVPGSPKYMTLEDGYKALTNVTWIQNEYFRLYREPLPDEIEVLLRESVDNHYPDVRSYADKKYNFTGKRAEIAAGKQKEHDDAIRNETAKAKDKEWSEKVGSNPNIRLAEPSRFSNLAKGVQAGEVKDPLRMSPEERHRATQTMIQKDISESQSA